MTKPSTHGHTKSGREITDEVDEQLAAEAETGYDVDTLIARRGKRGRLTLGASPAELLSNVVDLAMKND